MARSVGAQALDFTLKSMSASGLMDVTLSDNFGKRNTVLMFFPGAFTDPCTKEMCDVSNGLASFGDAAVYGISIDSAFAQKGWAKQNDIKQTLLSDYGHKVTRLYDAELPDLAGLGGPAAKRAVFVIDKAGIIRYVEVTPVPTEMPDFDALRELVANL